MKDTHDIHFARCRACCKSIKLQTMGEAALTSHAGGAGHKAAVHKLMEGSPASVLKQRGVRVNAFTHGVLFLGLSGREYCHIKCAHHFA